MNVRRQKEGRATNPFDASLDLHGLERWLVWHAANHLLLVDRETSEAIDFQWKLTVSGREFRLGVPNH